VLFLDALERDGWVRRLPHPKDRRAHIVSLTEAGEKRFEAVGLALFASSRTISRPLAPRNRCSSPTC
jgi:DNA-binding MarR family transcriptional regulator